jgi:hypothetical protein
MDYYISNAIGEMPFGLWKLIFATAILAMNADFCRAMPSLLLLLPFYSLFFLIIDQSWIALRIIHS